jgi:hypothetical protein
MPSRYPTNPETLERKLRETGAEGRWGERSWPLDGLDELGGGGLAHALEEVVPGQRRRGGPEGVGSALHRRRIGKGLGGSDRRAVLVLYWRLGVRGSQGSPRMPLTTRRFSDFYTVRVFGLAEEVPHRAGARGVSRQAEMARLVAVQSARVHRLAGEGPLGGIINKGGSTLLSSFLHTPIVLYLKSYLCK